MANKQDLHDSHHQQGTDRGHSAPVFYEDPKTGKPINTGLQREALKDITRRLVTDPKVTK